MRGEPAGLEFAGLNGAKRGVGINSPEPPHRDCDAHEAPSERRVARNEPALKI